MTSNEYYRLVITAPMPFYEPPPPWLSYEFKHENVFYSKEMPEDVRLVLQKAKAAGYKVKLVKHSEVEIECL